MGALVLPAGGKVYVDAQICIYSVERHAAYGRLLRPLWAAARAGQLKVATSELSLMESLILPLRAGNARLAADFEQFFQVPIVELSPISIDVLRQAAQLRAQYASLKTPDAIHAATGLACQAAMFLTNDVGLRQVKALSVTILNDVLASP